MMKTAVLAATAIVETQRGSDVPPPARAAGPWRTQNLLSALSSTAARAGLRRRLRARRTITPHRCEAPSLSAGPGPEARARVRRRTSAVDDPGRRRDVARHRRAAPRRRRRARRRRPLTSANEPDEFFASDFESMAPEEKLKDPLVLLGLGSIFLPFVMILGFQATGVILCGKVAVAGNQYSCRPNAIDATRSMA